MYQILSYAQIAYAIHAVDKTALKIHLSFTRGHWCNPKAECSFFLSIVFGFSRPKYKQKLCFFRFIGEKDHRNRRTSWFFSRFFRLRFVKKINDRPKTTGFSMTSSNTDLKPFLVFDSEHCRGGSLTGGDPKYSFTRWIKNRFKHIEEAKQHIFCSDICRRFFVGRKLQEGKKRGTFVGSE